MDLKHLRKSNKKCFTVRYEYQLSKELNLIDDPIYYEISTFSIRFEKKYFDCE
jgi:hypothetical protein